MKALATVPFLLAAAEALAFDSAEWLGKRELFAREAERMRSVYTNCVARLETPAEDVVVPIETFPDGSVKVLVTAKKAQYFLDTGLVWAQDVVVSKFRADGSEDGRIEANNCVVDRVAKTGWAEGPATVTHDKTVFRGVGVFFSSPDSYIKVLSKSDIESKDLKFGGVGP